MDNSRVHIIHKYPDEAPRSRPWFGDPPPYEYKSRQRADDSAVLPYVDMTDWDSSPAPPREWLVPDRIPHRNVTLVTGEGEAGKSLLMLQLTVGTVLGRGWLDTMPEQGPVLYVSCEDDDKEIRRRLAPILQQHDAKYADLIEGGFRLLCFTEENPLLVTPDKAGVLAPTPLFERLRQDAIELRPRAIIIDTSADVFGGDEINRAQVRRFVALLRKLAIEANSAVILIAHPSLTGISTGTGVSGSTGWHNSVRSRLYLKRVKAKDDQLADHDLRELEYLKNNYGARGDPVPLRWHNGLFVLAKGPVGLDKLAADSRAEDVFLKLLARFTEQRQNVSNKTGTTYAPAAFAAHRDAGALSKKTLADAMQRLLDAGKIRIEVTGPPSRERSKLVLE